MTTKAKSTGHMTVAYSFDPNFLSARMETIEKSAIKHEQAHEVAREEAEILGYERYWVLEFFDGFCANGASYARFNGAWYRRPFSEGFSWEDE